MSHQDPLTLTSKKIAGRRKRSPAATSANDSQVISDEDLAGEDALIPYRTSHISKRQNFRTRTSPVHVEVPYTTHPIIYKSQPSYHSLPEIYDLVEVFLLQCLLVHLSSNSSLSEKRKNRVQQLLFEGFCPKNMHRQLLRSPGI